MMKQKLNARGMLFALLATAGVWTLGSCADGYDSPNGFDSGVKNTVMQTPERSTIVLKTNQAGDQATISWPLVKGCNGHEVTMTCIDDPENPVVVDGYDKKIVDGSSMIVNIQEDSRYSFSIRTLGNQKLGNKDSELTVDTIFQIGVPSLATIPAGTDDAPTNLNEWWEANQPEYSEDEWAYDLEPDGRYEITDTLDLSIHKLTIRGSKERRPIIYMKSVGTITTCSGLKMKYINFDNSSSSANGVIGMTRKENCPDSIKSQNLGYMRDGAAINNIYIVQDPIYFAHCWFKNVARGFMVADENQDCAWWYLTIDDCIIQFNSTSGRGFLALRPGGRTIKYVTITNSTIYNIQNNSSAYFAQYANRSNANALKVFGNSTAEMTTQIFTLSHVTFSKMYSRQSFANDISYSILYMDHDLFYDTYGVRQLPRWCSNKTYKFNFWWDPDYAAGTSGGHDSQDLSQKDSGGADMVAIYDFGWTDEMVTKELDLSQPNGGVDFRPRENEIVKYGGGDSRWLE